MKQIPFDPELIGKPGIVCKVDGEVPEYIKEFKKDFDPAYSIRVVAYNGIFMCLPPNDKSLTMFRQTKSAEEIAREVYSDTVNPEEWLHWEQLNKNAKEVYTALVQAGMDEVTDKNE